MGGFEFGEELFGIATLAPFGLVEALPDALVGVCMSGDVEQSLIGLRVLNHCGSLAPHRKDNRAFTFPQLLHEIAGLAAEAG
jgi:hypothetical protein